MLTLVPILIPDDGPETNAGTDMIPDVGISTNTDTRCWYRYRYLMLVPVQYPMLVPIPIPDAGTDTILLYYN